MFILWCISFVKPLLSIRGSEEHHLGNDDLENLQGHNRQKQHSGA